MSSLIEILNFTERRGLKPESISAAGNHLEITALTLVDDFDEFPLIESGSLVVLTRRLSCEIPAYRLDILVRIAIDRGAQGLILFKEKEKTLSKTATALAKRNNFSIICYEEFAYSTSLLQAIANLTEGNFSNSIDRFRSSMKCIDDFNAESQTFQNLLLMIAVIWGQDFVNLKTTSTGTTKSVHNQPDIEHGGNISTASTNDLTKDLFLELTVTKLSECLNRSETRLRQLDDARFKSCADVLIRVIESDIKSRDQLRETASRLGITEYAWNVIVRFEFEENRDMHENIAEQYESHERITKHIYNLASQASPFCITAQCASEIVLLLTFEDDRDLDVIEYSTTLVKTIFVSMLKSEPSLRLFCGVGSKHKQINGIFASANESRLAAHDARIKHFVNHPVAFEHLKILPALLEWQSISWVQESINELFAPLKILSNDKQSLLVHTLTTYLNLNCSISETADELYLHRNAVRYRLDKIYGLLKIDRTNAEQQLFLHLACRAREITHVIDQNDSAVAR